MSDALLRIRDLTVNLQSGRGEVRAVEGVSLDVHERERVGVIGESGSGKSVTALSVLQLLDPRRVRYGVSSSITFRGDELIGASADRLRRLRGREVAMVFQDPMVALNPVFTIGDQLGRVVRSHLRVSHGEGRDRVVNVLREVEIQGPERQLDRYPHELSGGMRQRVLVGMALLCEPEVLIADEPTSALDVTVQAAVLETMRRLADSHGAATMLITHDMGVVARFCEVVHVLYGGRVMESGPVTDLFARPLHPYTAALLRCTPRIDGDRRSLVPIRGTQEVRIGAAPPVGCPFADRCPAVQERCRTTTPELRAIPDRSDAVVACHRAEELDLSKEIQETHASLDTDR